MTGVIGSWWLGVYCEGRGGLDWVGDVGFFKSNSLM